MITASRYRSPTREACAEVSLSEFDDDELREELENRNGTHSQGYEEGYSLSSGTLGRLATLILCGQRDIALQELCQELEPHVGKLLP